MDERKDCRVEWGRNIGLGSGMGVFKGYPFQKSWRILFQVPAEKKGDGA